MAIAEEVKASRGNSATYSPVTPAGGDVKDRLADVKKKVDPEVDNVSDDVTTPQGDNKVGVGPGEKGISPKDAGVKSVKESIESIFEGQDLSEDFRSKVETIFTAALHEAVEAKTAELDEELENRLEEEVSKSIDSIAEKLDSYLDIVAEKWIEKNELQVESAIKVEVAESFMEGLKYLFSEHNLEIDEEKVDALAEAEKRLEEEKKRTDELVEALIASKNVITDFKKNQIFDVVSEGLVDTDAERLKTLAESINFSDADDYEKKLTTIKESFFSESKAEVEDGTEYLGEETDLSGQDQKDTSSAIDPTVAGYLSSLNRTLGK